MKKVLTDRGLKALKPAQAGKRYTLWDSLLPNFGIRVTEKGHASFIVMTRLDGRLIRRVLGEFPGMELKDARDAARTALDDIGRGVDPKEREEAERREREQKRRDNFEIVAEDFIKRHVANLRTAKEVEAAIRRALITRWGKRPITSVTKRDVIETLNEVVDNSGPYAAHKVLAYTSKLFNWAIARDIYGLEHSPCDRIKPTDAIGRKQVRQRVLTDEEMRIFWAAAGKAGEPFGPLFRLLLLIGQRRDEVAGMRKPEVDLKKRLWTIPPERMKADTPHLVPLSGAAEALIEALPEYKGDFLFTTTGGERPVSGFSKAKTRLDAAMLKILQEEAAERGDDPAKVALSPWRIHDLRRTARTHFSAIPSQDLVRELAIGHTRPELHRVYDQHLYLDEKRALFDAWATRLMTIVTPPPPNVVTMRAGR